MKIVFITPVVPFVDGGTSAHIYHLMLGRDKNISIDIYTFNNNHRSKDDIKCVEQELDVRIHLIIMPRWIRMMFKMHLLFLRVFLKFPIFYYLKLNQQTIQEINSLNPDGVWIYGEELALITKQFPQYRRVHTLPDSEAMYFYRMLQQRFVTDDTMLYWKTVFLYRKYCRMEKAYDDSSSVTHHLVGLADVNFIKNNNPKIDARFIRHPHYHILNPNRELSFHQPKIKILIAGQYNYYMKQEADLLVAQFRVLSVECLGEEKQSEAHNSKLKTQNFLKEHYVFTFLGKGWERHVETLRKAGYEVEHITFAPNYQDELVKHDIQITPIAIGTGTKGKVLDALANGLLVIGTPYAMENIAVENGVSCIEYHEPQEVIDVLKDIPSNMDKYEQMAIKGREAILTIHGRETVSKQLFSMFQDTRITKYSKL